jgi:Mg2+ and Co2+ transporter CorA
LEALPSVLDLASSQDWYWFHFASAHEQARHLIRALSNLPEDAKDSLIDQDGDLRLDVEGDTVYGAIADFERDLSDRNKETAKLSFALNGRMFISMRRHALYSTDLVRRHFERGCVPALPIDLLEMIFSHFAHAAARELSEIA